MSNNPYQSPTDTSAPLQRAVRGNKLLWTTMGFLIGASVPVAFGAVCMYQLSVTNAALPANAPRCGNDYAGACLIIAVLAPLTGAFGSTIASIAFNEVYRSVNQETEG